jgi:preprotein translocase subunit YajC
MSTAPLLALFAPSGQGGPGITAFVIQIGLFIAIFYFLLIRPQRRQQQEHKLLLASLQRGDKVVTSSGIVGEVVHIKDDEVTVRSGEAKFVILRSGIASITNRTAAPAIEAKSS